MHNRSRVLLEILTIADQKLLGAAMRIRFAPFLKITSNNDNSQNVTLDPKTMGLFFEIEIFT